MNYVGWLSLGVAAIALFFTFRREFFIVPRVKYSITLETEYSAGSGISLAVERIEVPGMVALKYGIRVHVRSTGRKSASDVQIRARAKGGAIFVQAHKDESNLIERLPDIGRQGSPEVFVNIPLMVRGEEVELILWYGIPNARDTEPPVPSVLVRHADGMGVLEMAA